MISKSLKWWLLFPLLFVVIAVLYFQLPGPGASVTSAVPDRANFVLQVQNVADIQKKMYKAEWWQYLNQQLSGTAFFDMIDSAFVSAPQEYFEKVELLYAFLPDSTANHLLVLKFPDLSSEKQFRDHFKKFAEKTDETKLPLSPGIDLKKMSLAAGPSLYIAYIHGLVIITGSPGLILEAEQLIQNSHENMLLSQMQPKAGSHSDAILYLSSPQTRRYIFHSDKRQDNPLLNLPFFTELDAKIKPKEVLLGGISCVCDSNQVWNFMKTQQAQYFGAKRLMPYNTTSFSFFGAQSFSGFFELLRPELSNSDFEYGFAGKLEELMHKEWAIASTAEKADQLSDKLFACTRIKDPITAATQLQSWKKMLNGSQTFNIYRGIEVVKLNRKDLINKILHNDFGSETFVCLIDEYLVWASNPNMLENIIHHFQNGHTLDLNRNYQTFADNLFEESNYLYYVNLRKGYPAIKPLLNKNLSDEISPYEFLFEAFESVGFQLKNSNEKLLTNLHINFNPDLREENIAVWKATLDADVIRAPYFVWDHQNKRYNLFVFDAKNQAYLIDYEGRVLWKYQLNEMPISPVFVVDYYKNGKYQYFFNSENFFYLVDLLGRDVGTYPMKLNSPATGPVSVYDYDKRKDYRIFYPGIDKKIHNYTIQGDPVRGWKNPGSQDFVRDMVTHLRVGNKDYILFSDVSGKPKIVNRKGNVRIALKTDFTKARHSGFYVNKTNSKGIILTTDEKGHLVYIGSDGAIQQTVFNEFSSDHFFLYEDFDQNASKDFIFLDGNKLMVFDRFKKILFQYEFPEAVTSAPKFVKLSNKKSLLGVVLEKTEEIYLFDQAGQVVVSRGLVGDTPFEVGPLSPESGINLISASSHVLFNYSLR